MIPLINIWIAAVLSAVGVSFMILGIVVFLQNPRSHIQQAFAGAVTGTYVVVLLEVLRLTTADYQTLLLSYRLTYAVAAMVVATILYFTLVFPDDPDLPVFWRNLILLSAAALAALALFTNQIVAGLAEPVPAWMGPQDLVVGPLNVWFRIFILVYILIALCVLIYKWARARGINQTKLLYLLLSFLVGGGLIAIPLMLLPSRIFESFSFVELGAGLAALIALQGITRYRLFRSMPFAAAEQIMDTLKGTILVLDLDSRIVYGQMEDKDVLEPLLRPAVEQVIAGRRVVDHRINFKGRFILVNASFISEGGGVLVILSDISEIERSITEQNVIRERLVKRLQKETLIRRALASLAQVKEEGEIRSIVPPVEISSDPELMQAIARLERATRNRLELLAKSRRDHEELLKKVEEAERVYNAGVQRELEVVELREKIRKLKEAKGIL